MNNDVCDLTRYFEDNNIPSEPRQGTCILSPVIAKDPCDILVYNILWREGILP